MFNVRISGKKKNVNIFYSRSILFCIFLHKADFIMNIVAQVSDLAHGPLV